MAKLNLSKVIAALKKIKANSSTWADWSNYTELAQSKSRALVNKLVKMKLLVGDSLAAVQEVVAGIGINDSLRIWVCEEPVARAMADWMPRNLRGWRRIGNVLMHLASQTTHYPHWDRDNPAYDSTKTELTLAFIGVAK